MVSLDCDTTTAGDVTLVTLELTSDEPAHVRVENCLDGPVWPPRREGVPAEGWDDDGFSGVVDGRLALGYATPADPADRPARVADVRPPDGRDATTPEDVVRDLGDPTPPADAVAPASGEPVTNGSADDATDRSLADERAPGNVGGVDEPASPTSRDAAPPQAVTEWLDAVEKRLADAEQLASAASVEDAATAVEAVGGGEDVQRLQRQLAADREALVEVRDRCERLAERAQQTTIPAETLARLA